ncbi:M20/M25/M40 family metallo-hydrolase [Agathobaculum desmolans]|uniref:M20/M25/M40 family metallo-hydrolase n=1 Tax=Agathobaculum desmolans TaxID=39484 RepID=UPI00248DF921|nr:M20/M25/M40 family metallo-hydrolase [Agathobaculum desmolans]
MQLEKTLQTLCSLPAVSGFEEQAARTVCALLEPYCDSVTVDRNGNVMGYRSCGRENAKTILLDAHLDQIGFVVTEVLEDGFLRFAPVGGVDPRMLLAGEVTILAEQPLYGVIACLPPHLLKAGEQDKAVPVDRMLIDTGLTDAKSRIRVGTPIVFGQQPVALAGGQYCSKCLDDRAGVAAILLALDRLQQENSGLHCNIAVLFSAQEEVTGLGAQTGAFAVQPEYAIAVDVTHGKTPDGPSDGVFELGSGAAIGVGPNLHRGLTQQLIRTAKAYDIAHSLEVMEGNTGTNAWTMQIVAHGIATALLSIPEKYMHTPVEVVQLSDVEAVADLMAAFLRTFDGEVRG